MRWMILYFFIFSSSWAFAATCDELQSSAAAVSDPQQLVSESSVWTHAKSSKQTTGFYLFSITHLRFLCAQLPDSEKPSCTSASLSILDEALTCLNENLNMNQVRAMSWAYLRHKGLGDQIQNALSAKVAQEADRTIMLEVWRKWHVMILPGGLHTAMGKTKSLTSANLMKIKTGFETLQKAIENFFGKTQLENFSHLWNAGGLLARTGDVTYPNQLGQARVDLPFQINLVTDALPDPIELGVRIAHETSHLNDYLRGYLMTGKMGKWTEQPGRALFRLCQIEGPAILPEALHAFVPDSRLKTCIDAHKEWLNFHKAKKSNAYAAFNITEFYTKMVDAWVRENDRQVPKDQYRKLSPETETLWSEMENALILGQRPLEN